MRLVRGVRAARSDKGAGGAGPDRLPVGDMPATLSVGSNGTTCTKYHTFRARGIASLCMNVVKYIACCLRELVYKLGIELTR